MQNTHKFSSAVFICCIALLCLTSGLCFAQTGAKGQKRSSGDTTAISASTSPEASAMTSWSFLSLGACGVDQFIKDHPTFDGRGTIVAVLDDGVDPGIEGLLLTSEGKRKLIDVQDFSGTGDITYKVAGRNGDKLFVGATEVLSGLSAKQIAPIDGTYYYAVLDESRFKNGLGDINFNGGKTDQFGILIYQDKPNHYVAIVDGDADGNISTEPVLANFSENADLVRLRNSPKSDRNDERFLSAAVTIYPEEHRINLYFADGGHGTHVAGIAAGCNIDGQRGFNGVAPGAELVAVKFADNTAGGVTVTNSMKRAYEYVVKLAQKTGKPVIANMSFGIGNEAEGKAVMDDWLDSLLDAHPEVIVCISAGNEGPGISTIGLPSSARNVISSGAALPNETARDLYGIATQKTVVWDFSSRGAELAKPTIVSPGTAISTVPDYVTRDRYNGTSMASPYTTGCAAVLASAMLQSFPSYKPNLAAMKRAFELGAVHLDGMTLLDEGAGLLNVPKSFDLLSKWQKENTLPQKFSIQVALNGADGNGTAAYYRDGNYPKNSDRTTFHIAPLQGANAYSRSGKIGFHAYDLVSNTSWLIPVEHSIYHRGLGSLEANVRYDEKLLQAPGLYVGKILGYTKGASRTYPAFELWSTIVIPYELNAVNNYAVEIKNIPIKSGLLNRYYFRIAPGTKAVRVSISGNGKTRGADAAIFDNKGQEYQYLRLRASDDDDEEKSRFITGDELRPGVWEIVVKRGIGSEDELASTVDLSVEAFPLEMNPQYLRATSTLLSGKFSLISNLSAVAETGTSKAVVEGYERYYDTTISSGDTFLMRFKRLGSERVANFDLKLEPKDFNLFTDISYQILKPDSSAVSNRALDWGNGFTEVKFTENDSTIYLLKFRGGLAVAERPHSFTLHIRERRIYDPTVNNYTALIGLPTKLYPSLVESCSFGVPVALPPITESYHYYGTLLLTLDKNRFEFPVEYGK